MYYDYERTVSGKVNPDKRFLKGLFPDELPLVGHPAETKFAVPWATERLPTKLGFVNLMRNEEYNPDGNSETSCFRRVRKYKKDKKSFTVLEKAPDPIHEVHSIEDYMFMVSKRAEEEDDTDETEDNGEPKTPAAPLKVYVVGINGAAMFTTNPKVAHMLGGVLVEDDDAIVSIPMKETSVPEGLEKKLNSFTKRRVPGPRGRA